MGKHRLSDDRPARRPPVAPAPPAAPPDWPHVQANGNGTADAHAGQPTVPAAPFTPLPAGPPHATTRRHNGVPAPPGLTGSIAAQPRSLFRNRSFRLLFSAAAVSMFGTQVSLLALPLVAVIALNATPVQVGVLGTLSTAAFLLIGLPAGAWLDRIRRRRVMVIADFVRTALIGSIPAAWWLGALTLPQLYVVVFLNGLCTVFFDVASQSYLPAIVAKDRLVEANSRLSSWDAANSVAGPGAAGYLVQLLTPPVATAVDAATYLWSAVCLFLIPEREQKPKADGEHHLIREIKEGVVLVARHPLLRPIAINGVATNLSMAMTITMLPLMFRRELGLSAGTLGLFFALDGIGVLLGTVTARRVTGWLGQGRALWIIGLAVTPACALFPMVNRGRWLWIAGVAWLVLNYRIGVNNVILISFRQRVTPHRLLGRMNATMRFLMTGVLAIGSALAGGIGQFVGIRAALWVSSIGLALVWLPLFFSPMRGMRELPQEPLEDSDSAPSVPHRAPEPPTALEQPTVEQPTVGGESPGQGRLTITVRPAVESDLPTVLALYGELQTADVPSSFGPAARVWQETAAQVGRTILLAVVDGFVVGTVDCMILPSLTRGGRPFMLVENLVVASAVRRHGVGRRLVGTAVTLARSAGCYEVQLTSRVDRADVHGFYESCGFQPVAMGYRARL